MLIISVGVASITHTAKATPLGAVEGVASMHT